MLNFSSNFILRYRLVCLLLSVGYFFYQFTAANYENFGIQFRYLTIWGLTGAMVSSYLLYRSKRNNLPETYRAFVSAVAVLNAMVVFLYWKLYFIDPSLVVFPAPRNPVSRVTGKRVSFAPNLFLILFMLFSFWYCYI